MTDKPDKLKTMIEEEFTNKYTIEGVGGRYFRTNNAMEEAEIIPKVLNTIYQIAKKWGEEKVKEKEAEVSKLEKLIDDIIITHKLENQDTSVIKEAIEILKQRYKKGKSLTAYWYRRFDKLKHK